MALAPREIPQLALLPPAALLYTDGSYQPSTGRSGWGLVLIVKDKVVLEACGAVETRVRGANYFGALKQSSNVAELTAILSFMLLLPSMGWWTSRELSEAGGLRICSDSMMALRVCQGASDYPKEHSPAWKTWRTVVNFSENIPLRFSHIRAHTQAMSGMRGRISWRAWDRGRS